MTTVVPATQPLAFAVASLESIDQGHLFGHGTHDSPLFPVYVPLTGQDSHALAIMARVSRAVRSYLREQDLDRTKALELEDLVGKEMRQVRNNAEFLDRVMCLVLTD